MNTNKKFTKRDKFNALLSLLSEMDATDVVVEGLTIADMSEFVEHEVELLNNKNAAKGEKKPTEKQKQNSVIGESVLEYLRESGESLTITQIIKAMPNLPEDMTNQRMTHIVTAMVNADTVEKVVEKRVSYFKAK